MKFRTLLSTFLGLFLFAAPQLNAQDLTAEIIQDIADAHRDILVESFMEGMDLEERSGEIYVENFINSRFPDGDEYVADYNRAALEDDETFSESLQRAVAQKDATPELMEALLNLEKVIDADESMSSSVLAANLQAAAEANSRNLSNDDMMILELYSMTAVSSYQAVETLRARGFFGKVRCCLRCIVKGSTWKAVAKADAKAITLSAVFKCIKIKYKFPFSIKIKFDWNCLKKVLGNAAFKSWKEFKKQCPCCVGG